MKKKLIIFTYIVLAFICIKIISNYIINLSVIYQYNKSNYSSIQASLLKIGNFFQPYIAYYNTGNVNYKKGKYEIAMDNYKKALKYKIPKYKECKIRINYALAICSTVEVDETSKESIEEAIKTYEKAISILVEEGCANKDDDNGHSKDAETLKKDIQNEIDRLKKLLESNESGKDNDDNDSDNNFDESEKVKQTLNDIKSEATQEQREKEQKDEDLQETYTSKTHKKTW